MRRKDGTDSGPSTARDVLVEARRLVETVGWCAGRAACDAAGKPCHTRDPKAASWCMIGAVDRVSGGLRTDLGYRAWCLLRRAVADRGWPGSVVDLNDNALKDGQEAGRILGAAARLA